MPTRSCRPPDPLRVLAPAALVACAAWPLGVSAQQSASRLVVPDELPDMTGAWVLEQRTTTVSRVAAVGRVRTETRAVVVFTLEQVGERVVGGGTVCSVSVDVGSPFVSTTVPEAFVDALGTQSFEARVWRDDTGVRLETPRSWAVVGADLDRPESDPLPASADAHTVRDDDSDGHPGVTIHVGGMIDGDVYVAQRSWSELSGRLLADGSFAGDVRFDQEQVVLGASRRALDSAPTTWVDPDADAHGFVLRRASHARCPGEATTDAARRD